MADIEDFSLHRQDGRTLTEGMGLADTERLGWPACPIVAVGWRHAGRLIRFDVLPGSFAHVVRGHRHVAVIAQQAENAPSRLLTVGPQGAVDREIPSLQSINGKMENVEFGWFEKSRHAEDDMFGVVVSLSRGVTYQLDVDASSGQVVQDKETR